MNSNADNRAIVERSPDEGDAAPGSLYILFAALLVGTLWSGGYFPVPKWIFLCMLLASAGWELLVLIRGTVSGRGPGGEKLTAPDIKVLSRSGAWWLLSGYIVFAVASYLWSISPSDSLREGLLLLGLVSVLVVVRAQVERDPVNLSRFAMWFAYVAAFLSAWGIVTYIFRVSPYIIFLDNVFRAGSTFEYSNALSCFLLMALPITSALMKLARDGDRPLYAVAIALMAAASVLTFSRLGMVLMALVVIYMLVSGWRGHLAAVILAAVVAGVAGAALVVQLSDSGREILGLVSAVFAVAMAWIAGRYLSRAGSSIQPYAVIALAVAGAVLTTALVKLSERAESILTQRVWQGFTPDRLLPHRLETFRGAVDAFHTHPLAGSGLGTFAEVYQQHTVATYTKFAHNLVLQTAVDTGLVGAVLLTMFLLYVLIVAGVRLIARKGSLTCAFAVAALVFLAFNMVDWEWYIPSLTAWFMVAVAAMEAGVSDADAMPAEGTSMDAG